MMFEAMPKEPIIHALHEKAPKFFLSDQRGRAKMKGCSYFGVITNWTIFATLTVFSVAVHGAFDRFTLCQWDVPEYHPGNKRSNIT